MGISIHANMQILAHQVKHIGNFRMHFFNLSLYYLDLVNGQNSFRHNRWDQMGTFDIPSVVNYILTKTGRAKLSYIGYITLAYNISYSCASVNFIFFVVVILATLWVAPCFSLP